jgi:ACS family D-galactonate transporter-like MFS transporter
VYEGNRYLSDAINRRRWTIAFLLSLGVLVNYFDRVNLTVSHDALTSEFGINDVTFGFLLGAYNWTYAACQLPSGVLLDRFGVRKVGIVSILLWSIASFAAALTRGVGGFLGARFLLGVGEASTFPANAKAIGYWFPAEQRSLATSLFDASAKLSSAIGVPLIGFLLLRVGWRLSFVATGVVSLLYFVIFYMLYRDPQSDTSLTSTGNTTDSSYPANEGNTLSVTPKSNISVLYLLSRKNVIGLAVGFGSYNYVFYLMLTWLPVYLSRALHIDLAHSFAYTGVPWICATAADLIVGGWLVDWLIRRGWNADRVRRVVLIGGTTMGLGILGATHAHTPGQALFWISLSISGLSAAAPVGWSIPSLIAPGDSVGKVGGIMNLSNQISGIAAPIITGYLVSGRQSFGAAFGVAATYLVIGILAYIFLLGEIRPIAFPVRTA